MAPPTGQTLLNIIAINYRYSVLLAKKDQTVFRGGAASKFRTNREAAASGCMPFHQRAVGRFDARLHFKLC